ncbi:hypothetical protein Tcan_12914 [Toxocara canis]|uniref:Uncharacterized protein n=2 Tax=Toxocara canis TaxID=6265 RepID=A0A0B2VUC8_TOXCA|nr:hypothetical protein Tcan_12914 [Toxocara canis]VDM38667.1 unnamed protein product [Toxocara canis]
MCNQHITVQQSKGIYHNFDMNAAGARSNPAALRPHDNYGGRPESPFRLPKAVTGLRRHGDGVVRPARQSAVLRC